jgi:Tol biopolymer transport system component
MPWSEEEFRRALEGSAERVRPRPDALAMLHARSRRRERTRSFSLAFAGAAAAAVVVLVGLRLQPSPPQADVEFAAPSHPAASSSAAPVLSEEADGGSILAEISGDGRFLVFMSEASNLVPGDTNGAADTFVRDLSTGRLERVSVSSSGGQGNAASLSASISRDGRFVAFRSFASNFVAGDGNGTADIFLRDRVARTTTIVSTAPNGAAANAASDSASISADGRLVAFRSLASNLVAGDTNRVADIFVRDPAGDSTVRLTKSTAGVQANSDSRNPQISADGTRVVFSSYANSLVTGDTNRTWDVFMNDLSTEETTRLSVSTSGMQANGPSTFPTISADGGVVAFVSAASNLIGSDTNRVRDAFVRDVAARTTERVSVVRGEGQANGQTLSAVVSGSGRFVAFSSDASNLVAGDRNAHRDVFELDRSTGTVTLVSVASDGAEGDADSGGPSISSDGRFVAFQSFATTLAAADTNGVRDVFVHDLPNRTTGRASVA